MSAFRKAVEHEADKRNLSYTSETTTKNILAQCQKHEKEKHKKKGTVGRPKDVDKKVMQALLKKKGFGVTGSKDILNERLEKKGLKKKGPSSPIAKKNVRPKNMYYINKNVASADDVVDLMGVTVGDVVIFKNKVRKQVVECSTGGHRWKNLD